MSAKLEVLWVTSEPPDRGGGGGGIRLSHLVEQLASRVTLDLLISGNDPDEYVAPVVRRVDTVPHPERRLRGGEIGRRAITLFDALLLRGPFEGQEMAPARNVLAGAVAARGHYDAVLVEHLGLAPLIRYRRPGEAWLLTLQNLPSITATQAVKAAAGRRQRWVWHREEVAARRRESAAMTTFDAVIAVSDDDASTLRGSAEVVPNGVDLEQFVPLPLPTSQTVLFTGSLHFLPNIDGLEWFCREIWPQVRNVHADARFVIVGRSPLDRVRVLAGRDGVSLHPDVDSVVPYLRDSRMLVVPLRQGSGTRLKALEALASGRPLIGTSTGLAGLGLADGIDALIRDDAAGFAAAIVEVLDDERLASRLATRGPEVAAKYSWSTIGQHFGDVVSRAAGRTGGST